MPQRLFHLPLFAAVVMMLVNLPVKAEEFKPYPYQFGGAWGINSCKDWVMEFRRGEFMQCNTGNKQCVENPAKYSIQNGNIYVIRDASKNGVRYDVHLIYKMVRGCVTTVEKQIKTDHGSTPIQNFDGNILHCKCKKGLLWGWNSDR